MPPQGVALRQGDRGYIMQERRKRFWAARTPLSFRFVNTVAILMIFSFLANAFIVIKILGDLPLSVAEALYYKVIQLNFLGIILILTVTLTFILHYSIGALPRIESILERVLEGNYSLRIHVRKRDSLVSLAEKINKILDLLEKRSGK
jgi:HAMP domain-containing protein